MTTRRARAILPLALAVGMGTLALSWPEQGVSSDRGAQADEPAGVLGYMWPEQPHVAPGDTELPEASIATVRLHMEAGDDSRALREAERLVASKKWGRERAAANLLIGMLYRERQLHNAASEAFTQVRHHKGPLRSWGAYYEAEQDLERGRASVAARECAAYLKAYPQGVHRDACARIRVRGLASSGRSSRARAAAAEYDQDHPLATISEQIELAIAERLVDRDPSAAIRQLKKLALEHRAPLTGRRADELLAQLLDAGHAGAVLPDDDYALQQRAISLREVRRRDESWALYQELARRGADNPKLARWVEAEASTFGWRTHNWDFLAELYGARYDDHPNGEDAYNAHKVLSRGGRFADASKWIDVGLDKHSGTRWWRRSEEKLARTLMLAGLYSKAREQFDTRAKRGGWYGRRARFYAAFCQLMDGQLDDAIERFDGILSTHRAYLVESRYWRHKAALALAEQHRAHAQRARDEASEADSDAPADSVSSAVAQVERHERRAAELEAMAQADRQHLLTSESNTWYALLLRQGELPDIAPWRRGGGWADEPLPALPQAPTHTLVSTALPYAQLAPAELSIVGGGWSQLSWPLAPSVAPTLAPEPTEALDLLPPGAPPLSYGEGALFHRDAAIDQLHKLARKHGGTWPELPAIADMVRVGLYDMAGPLMSRFYEDAKTARRSSRYGAYRAARSLPTKSEFWRPLFYAARDHHHTDRFTYGMWEELDDADTARRVRRLGYPLAHDRHVWRASRRNGVDPLLVLGLMRTESRYDALALSRVGARGAMQIMPRTGHLMADIRGDQHFLAGDLEEPVVAVEMGIDYLGLLLERFDGNFPLAVASYNGGPHNVSAWLKGTGTDMPIDAFVEHIPYRETRRYVRSVSRNYDAYVELYAESGSAIAIPNAPYSDDPSVVNF